MSSPHADPARRASRPSGVRRGIAAALLAAVLAIPVLLQRDLPFMSVADAAGGSQAMAFERFGFHLDDVAAEVGIDFRHRAPELDDRLREIMPLIASTGASVTVADFNRNGLPDLYVTTSEVGGMNALYMNRGDGTFEDVAAELGVADLNQPGAGVSMGAVWGDYTNNGFEDLFLYKWGRAELFRNDEGEGFTRVTEVLDLPSWVNAGTAIWLDFDRDGWLDLFVGGYYPPDVDLWALETMRFLPESFEYAQNGGRNYLLRNRGDGTFQEIGEEMGLATTRWSLAAAAGDVTGNGYPDILVANDFGVSELFLNEEGTGFREVGRESNVGRSPKSGMNASFADPFNRGEWALFVSNVAEPGILMHGNDLWMPNTMRGGVPVFRNVATALGIDLGGWTYGAQFADLNNDGWKDLIVANGFLSGERRDSYWYDYSKVATGYRSIIADASNWPNLEGRSLSGYQQNLFWANDGAGGFVDAASAVRGNEPYDARAIAVADLWGRGVLDVIVANQRGPIQVFRNEVAPGRHWIGFDLEGVESNRSGIGAELRLFQGAREQLQQVEGGSGFAAQRERRVHFGLGTNPQVDSVVVAWPSGIRETLVAPEADRNHRVVEGGIAAVVARR